MIIMQFLLNSNEETMQYTAYINTSSIDYLRMNKYYIHIYIYIYIYLVKCVYFKASSGVEGTV